MQEGPLSPELYEDTEESGSETEEGTDDESYEEDEMTESDPETDGDIENASSVTCSENGDSRDNNLDDDKVHF